MRSALVSLAFVAIASAWPLSELFTRQTSGCYSGFYVIVARGTSEDNDPFGRLGEYANKVVAAVPGSYKVAVNYPAKAIGSGDNEYRNSVDLGIQDTINKITTYVDKCKTSKPRVVLMGYSQGGQVMTDTLVGGFLQKGPIDTSYIPYIKATTALADPTFVAKQSYSAGNATTSGKAARQPGDKTRTRLNDEFGSTLRSYCSIGDPVCSVGSNASVHVAEVRDWGDQAVAFIVSKK